MEDTISKDEKNTSQSPDSVQEKEKKTHWRTVVFFWQHFH